MSFNQLFSFLLDVHNRGGGDIFFEFAPKVDEGVCENLQIGGCNLWMAHNLKFEDFSNTWSSINNGLTDNCSENETGCSMWSGTDGEENISG